MSVIVPVFNKANLLRQSLDSMVAAAQRYPGDVELILVDNHSSDGSYEILLEYREASTVLRCPTHRAAAVRNVGAARARGEILCFLDCDILVPPDYFAAVRDVLATTGAAAAGREVDIPSPAHWSERTWYWLHVITSDGYRHYINSANFAVRRDAFQSVGGFDESLIAAEDTDICKRLTLSGYRIYESHRLNVVHLDNPKSIQAFYRKQVWHGMSVLDGQQFNLRNKTTVMLFAHIVVVAVALVVALTARPLSPFVRAALVAGGLLAVPVVTVAYRFTETRRITDPLRAIFLYVVFYFARTAALLSILARSRATAA